MNDAKICGSDGSQVRYAAIPCSGPPTDRGVGFPYCDRHWELRLADEYREDQGDPGIPENQEPDDDETEDEETDHEA